jgi:RES domain-containing protein
MHVYRLSKEKFADDLTGEGARLFGNRWNSPGRAVLYTAVNRALTVLEVWASSSEDIAYQRFTLITLDIPEDNLHALAKSDLPADWATIPPSQSTAIIGNTFIDKGEYLGLWVPSVIIPKECNLLLNPAHPAMAKVKVVSKDPFPIDARLIRH